MISFKDKVTTNSVNKQRSQGVFSYLRLPKGINLFKEEASTTVMLDFLPYVITSENHLDRDDSMEIATPGNLWYKKPFFIHRNIGIHNETVVCPTSIRKKCPICDYKIKLYQNGATKAEINSVRPSRRNLYLVIPIDNREYEQKPHIWNISQYLFQDKLDDEIENDPNNAIFPDLEEGLSLKIRFGENKINNNKNKNKSISFITTSRIDFYPRRSQYDKSILSELPKLDECLIIYSYEDLERIFFGDIPEVEEPFESPEIDIELPSIINDKMIDIELPEPINIDPPFITDDDVILTPPDPPKNIFK